MEINPWLTERKGVVSDGDSIVKRILTVALTNKVQILVYSVNRTPLRVISQLIHSLECK